MHKRDGQTPGDSKDRRLRIALHGNKMLVYLYYSDYYTAILQVYFQAACR